MTIIHDTSLFIVTLCPLAQLNCTLLRVCFDIKATFQSDIFNSDIEALKGLKTGTKGYRVIKLLLQEAAFKIMKLKDGDI